MKYGKAINSKQRANKKISDKEKAFERLRTNEALEEDLAIANKRIETKQAIIDSLMLEYCPNEMTLDQMANWKKHQILVKEITSKEGV